MPDANARVVAILGVGGSLEGLTQFGATVFHLPAPPMGLILGGVLALGQLVISLGPLLQKRDSRCDQCPLKIKENDL